MFFYRSQAKHASSFYLLQVRSSFLFLLSFLFRWALSCVTKAMETFLLSPGLNIHCRQSLLRQFWDVMLSKIDFRSRGHHSLSFRNFLSPPEAQPPRSYQDSRAHQDSELVHSRRQVTMKMKSNEQEEEHQRQLLCALLIINYWFHEFWWSVV